MTFHTKHYNPAVQIGAMKSRYPQFKSVRRGDDIEFIGTLLVKPTLPVYTVSITYRGDLKPLVRILKPGLVEKPPHFYELSKSLCLYHPSNYHWSKDKLIAKDIVSWSAAWIYFYEKWLEKGIWYGPEAAHDDIDKSENN